MDFSFNIILLIVFHILASCAVSKDCTARAIEKKDAYVISSFFFPIIAGVIYACKRKKLSQAENMPANSSKLISSAKVLCIIAVLTFAVSGVAGTMSMHNSDPMQISHYDIIKYDREGKPYFFNQKINYYDRAGNTYQLTDTNAEFVNMETNEKYVYSDCVVDNEGYFLLVDGYRCEFVGDNIVSYEGHSYLLAMSARWDRDGLLYNSYGNSRVVLT